MAYVEEGDPPYKIFEAFKEWMEDQEISVGTQKLYARHGKRIIFSGHTPKDWLTHTIKPGTKTGTVKSYEGAAKKVWDFLSSQNIECGERPNLPKSMKLKRNQDHRDTLTDDQLRRYKEVLASDGLTMSPRLRAALLLLPETGMRVSEVCSIQLRNLTREGANYGVLIPHTHSKSKRGRWIPLNRNALNIIRWYRRLENPTGKWLFPSDTGKTYLLPGSVRNALIRIRPILGDWAESVSPHWLRHTFATQLIRKGVPIAIVKELMGHAQVQTTMIYVHPQKSDLAAATNLLVS